MRQHLHTGWTGDWHVEWVGLSATADVAFKCGVAGWREPDERMDRPDEQARHAPGGASGDTEKVAGLVFPTVRLGTAEHDELLLFFAEIPHSGQNSWHN